MAGPIGGLPVIIWPVIFPTLFNAPSVLNRVVFVLGLGSLQMRVRGGVVLNNVKLYHYGHFKKNDINFKNNKSGH